MMDAKLVATDALQVSEHVVSIFAILGRLHARRQHHFTWCKRPHVKASDSEHFGALSQRIAHGVRVDADRRGLDKHEEDLG